MRRLNWPLWAALLLSIITFVSWPFVFVRWPATRDVPWVNLCLMAATIVLGVTGLRRGFAPAARRGLKIVVSLAVATIIGVILWNFVAMVLIDPRQLPVSAGAPQLGQQAPDFSLPDSTGRVASLADLLAAPDRSSAAPPVKGILLVFYMYAGCRACNSEFRGIQQHLSDFAAAGVRPVAISIDPPGVSRRLSEEAGYTFTFLSDPKLEVIRRYDVAKPDGEARPAEFLIDTNHVVRWRNLTSNYYLRARPEQILSAAGGLK